MKPRQTIINSVLSYNKHQTNSMGKMVNNNIKQSQQMAGAVKPSDKFL